MKPGGVHVGEIILVRERERERESEREREREEREWERDRKRRLRSLKQIYTSELLILHTNKLYS